MNTIRVKRSVRIEPETLREIRKAIKSFHTRTEAAEAMKVERTVLHKLLSQNSCAPATLDACMQFLHTQKATA